ncbi:hypothetical protein RSAG8_11240, partial [Rhizoctonia solani AG-8 WAC10335]
MLDELRVSGDLLRLALDRYLNACLAIKRCPTEYSRPAGQPQFQCLTSRVVLNEISLLGEFETKLRKSKTAILQTANLHPDVVPISKLPTDILVRIFKQLTEEEYEHAFLDKQKDAINKYPMTLAHVCSNWRQIVFQSPLLWSYITLVPNIGVNKQRLAYLDFHSRYAKKALMDILITKRFRRASASPISIDPFIGRIRSLRLRLPLYKARSMINPRVKASHLISECLRAGHNALKRFTLHMNATPEQHPFMESVSHPVDRNSLLDIILTGRAKHTTASQLEDVLSSITNLWLHGYYFNWESKAYHGLTTLELESTGSHAIPESRLANILASSPQLQYLKIQLEIIQETIPPPPIHLSGLEVLVGDVLLLQLIWPGSKELSVNIIWQPNHSSSTLYSTRMKDFFSRANTVRLLNSDWFFSASDILYLLTMAPGVRVLALSSTKLFGTLPDMLTYPSLKALYLIYGCELDKPLLIDLANKWNIKKFVFWGENRIFQGSSNVIDSKLSMEEELSDLRSTLLEFIPCPTEDASAVEVLASQPWA